MKDSLNSPRHAWLLTDGKIGDQVQCLGVAQTLGVTYEERIVSPGRPWCWVMPHGPVPWPDQPQQRGSPIAPPFPDLVIGSGRRAIPYIRHIKTAAAGKTFTVILKDPRLPPHVADMIWVPEHDPLRGDNVITTPTSPHGITQGILQEIRQAPPPEVSALPAPRVAIMLGDPGNRTMWPQATVDRLVKNIRALARQAGGFMLSPSRRTPDRISQAVDEAIGDHPAWVWRGGGDNPYRSMLALADGLVVTADSHNMVSEALATGRPVLAFRPEGHNPKLARFLDRLEEQGLVRTFDGCWHDYSYPPIDATVTIASAIEKALAARENRREK